jgi:vesicle coat complex subunit
MTLDPKDKQKILDTFYQVLHDDRIPEIRAKAADALGKVADALGKVADTSSIPHLLAALKDSDSRVRECAAQALDKIANPPQSEMLCAIPNRFCEIPKLKTS